MDFEDFDTEVSLAENNFPKTEKLPEVETAEPESNLGLFEGISNEDYHSGRGISSSSLKYATKAMALYQAYLNKTVSFEETEAMRLGTATHKMCLEAYDFGSEIIIGPKFGRKAADKEAKKEFYEEHEGKTIITADQYEHCSRMTESIMSFPLVDEIFNSGKPELSGYYVDNGGDETFLDGSYRGTNMLCKYRPDWRTDWCLADLKTTRDISKQAFSRTIHNLQYHISAAHYLEGDRILGGDPDKQFVFLCVEPEPPYLAMVYVLDEDSLQLGKEDRRQALNAIKLARDTKEYPLYNNGIAEKIGVPQYAHFDSVKAKV